MNPLAATLADSLLVCLISMLVMVGALLCRVCTIYDMALWSGGVEVVSIAHGWTT